MKSVYKFYNSLGWNKSASKFEDAKLFEDLRFNSREYVSKCRKRILRYIPSKGLNILDFASGPIQYNEYLLYSKNFKYRHCVDFSREAIRIAKSKIKKNGKFYCKDFLKIDFKKNYFDCIISLHTIYHISKLQQKRVVIKFLNIIKKKKPIIIVYSNPNSIINKIKLLFFYDKFKKTNLYFFCHPISWWKQFEDRALVEFKPWRSFSSNHQKFLFPNNFLGKFFFKILFYLEDIFQPFFVKNFQYYTVILTKKN